MYNAISLELILHMYSQIGCIEGCDEWKCEDYVESDVLVKSPEGMLQTTFSHGLREGKGFSCPLALLVWPSPSSEHGLNLSRTQTASSATSAYMYTHTSTSTAPKTTVGR